MYSTVHFATCRFYARPVNFFPTMSGRRKRSLEERPLEATEADAPLEATEAAAPRWLLCTGQPGCGKTTLVRAVVEELTRLNIPVRGFYTEEVLDANGGRKGFDVVTVPFGRRAVLSRKSGLPASYAKTGAYSVDVTSFEECALPTIAVPDAGEIIIIDEVGRMELHSIAFQAAVRKLLVSQTRVVGAITAPIYGHRVPFCDEVVAQPQVRVVEKLTQKTRDRVREEMLREALALARKPV